MYRCVRLAGLKILEIIHTRLICLKAWIGEGARGGCEGLLC